MSDKTMQETLDAEAGADRMEAHLSCIPCSVKGDLEEVVRLRKGRATLLKAIKKHIEDCGSCGGTGTAHTCVEEDVGMPSGSSGIPCPECHDIRIAITSAEEATP